MSTRKTMQKPTRVTVFLEPPLAEAARMMAASAGVKRVSEVLRRALISAAQDAGLLDATGARIEPTDTGDA